MRRIVLTLCLALYTAPAWAADWDEAFPAAAVKSYVTGSLVRVDPAAGAHVVFAIVGGKRVEASVTWPGTTSVTLE